MPDAVRLLRDVMAGDNPRCRVTRNRTRPRCEHGCGQACGGKASTSLHDVHEESVAIRAATWSTLVTRQDGEHAFDVVPKLGHEVAQKARSGVVGDLTIGGEDIR